MQLCLLLAVATATQAGVVDFSAPAVAHAPFAYPAHATPLAYAHPAPLAYAQPSHFAYAHSTGPAVTYTAHAPAVSYAAPAPAVTYTAAAAPLKYVAQAVAPAVSYQTAPVKYVAAPAPLRYVASAPVVAHAPAVTYAAPAPVASLKYVAPAHVAVSHAPVAIARDAETIDPNPSYQFSYGVHDATTGDVKSQEESLQDGVLSGRYSLAEPDGSVRTVTYTADKVNGFNAHVERTAPGTVAQVAQHQPALEPAAEILP